MTQHSGLSFAFLSNLKECHKGQNVKGLHDLKRYLENFGYLNYGSSKKSKLINSHQNEDVFDDLLESAIKQYQSNYDLRITGNLNSANIRKMMIPRYGIPDIVNGTNSMAHRKCKMEIVATTIPIQFNTSHFFQIDQDGRLQIPILLINCNGIK